MADRYYKLLARQGLVPKARAWLKANPPPLSWQGSVWAWAWTEMPALPAWIRRLFQ